MDAKIETKLFPDIYRGIDICNKELDKTITTVKYEFRIANSQLEGEQFNVFTENAFQTCANVANVINQLNKLKAFLENIEREINNYDKTRLN